MPLNRQFDWLFHRFLRIPHTLHTELFQNPKKPKETYVFIHGIGGDLHAWDKVIKGLPADVRIIGIDLLGFGNSPKPSWVIYNAKTQARSVAKTLLGMRLAQRPVLVGHSLGAFVSIELAKLYPYAVKEMLLCSPPFYKPELVGKRGLKSQDDMLRELYRLVKRHPERLKKLSPRAAKLGLANRALNINDDNVESYIEALESSIINQTALKDVRQLKLPITIFYGALDAVVIGKHIVALGREMENVMVKRLMVGHEVGGSYAKSLKTFILESQFDN